MMAANLTLSGCGMGDPRQSEAPIPTKEIVSQIERRMSQSQCVGKLSDWERLYSYGYNHHSHSADISNVEIIYRQAGVHGFKSGARAGRPGEWVNLDDRRYRTILGSYELSRNHLTITYCGNNTA